MRKGSLSGFDHLEGPLWPAMPLESKLGSVLPSQVTMKSEIHVDILQSVQLPDALVAALGCHGDLRCMLCNHLRPCRGSLFFSNNPLSPIHASICTWSMYGYVYGTMN